MSLHGYIYILYRSWVWSGLWSAVYATVVQIIVGTIWVQYRTLLLLWLVSVMNLVLYKYLISNIYCFIWNEQVSLNKHPLDKLWPFTCYLWLTSLHNILLIPGRCTAFAVPINRLKISKNVTQFVTFSSVYIFTRINIFN